MKLAIIIIIGCALFYIAYLLMIEVKNQVNQDIELLSEVPSKPPSKAVAQQSTLEDLLDAIEWVESKGNAKAIGDNGEAVGIFQIHKIYMEDVNRINRKQHTDKYLPPVQYEDFDRKNPYLSRFMVFRYLKYYATKKRIGREPTFEDIARIHNGGPDGWKKDCTKPYWEKVEARLECQ